MKSISVPMSSGSRSISFSVARILINLALSLPDPSWIWYTVLWIVPIYGEWCSSNERFTYRSHRIHKENQVVQKFIKAHPSAPVHPRFPDCDVACTAPFYSGPSYAADPLPLLDTRHLDVMTPFLVLFSMHPPDQQSLLELYGCSHAHSKPVWVESLRMRRRNIATLNRRSLKHYLTITYGSFQVCLSRVDI